MNHALIIDDNMIVSRAIQNRLEGLGFTSFDHTWTEEQAVAAASRRAPSLVVIGDEVEAGSALGAARRISSELAVPVLMVTGDPVRAQGRLAKVDAFEGPFLLNQIEEAVTIARAVPRLHSRGAGSQLDHAATANAAPRHRPAVQGDRH